ncbi:hypothetical protein ACQP1U_16600 [Actinomycetota bacterium]
MMERSQSGDGESTQGREEMPVIPTQSGPALPLPARSREVAAAGGRAAGPLVSVFSSLSRTGRWTVPAQPRVVAVFGDAKVDLREADWPSDVLELRAGALFGSLTVYVPRGTDVQLDGTAIFSDEKLIEPPLADGARAVGPQDGMPGRSRVLRIRSLGVFSEVKVYVLAPGEDRPKWWKPKG